MKDERMSDAADVASGLVDVLRRAADPFDAREREVMTSNATFILRHLTQMLVPVATSADVTAMLEEVARLDAAATPGPWERDLVGKDWAVSRRLCGVVASAVDRLDDVDFIARARTLLPALAKALEASEQGARMLREDHDNGVALLRKAEAEIDALRAGQGAHVCPATIDADTHREQGRIAAELFNVRAKLETLRERAQMVLDGEHHPDDDGECSSVSRRAMADLRTTMGRP